MQQTFLVAHSTTFWASAASDDRCDDSAASLASKTILVFRTAVAASVTVSGKCARKDLVIIIDFSRLLTGTAIVVYGAWLNAGKYSVLLESVSNIPGGTLATSMNTVAEDGGWVRTNTIVTENTRTQFTAGSLFVCRAYCAKQAQPFYFSKTKMAKAIWS